MDGAELLGRVRDQHPDVVRIVLSGNPLRVTLDHAATVAHAVLGKPCPIHDLEVCLARFLGPEDAA